LLFWINKYNECQILIGGDLNVDLDDKNSISDLLNNFLVDNDIRRCDKVFPNITKQKTFINEAVGCVAALIICKLHLEWQCRILAL